MEIFRVSLFGHRDLSAHKRVENGLSEILQSLIATEQYVEIYIGRSGEFDVFAASVVKRIQKEVGRENSELTLILPYVTKDIEFYEKYYDSILIPESLMQIHPKRAITLRNQWMVDKCDLLICYVERENGRAYTALQYAKDRGKKIINLADSGRDGKE